MIQIADNLCRVCGRRGKRYCAVMTGMICSACCGEKRGVSFNCPPDCDSFPFGTKNYDLWLKVDDAWHDKITGYIAEKIGNDFLPIVDKFMWSRSEEDSNEISTSAIDSAVHYCMGFPYAEGKLPLGELWEKENWRGLNNDETYMTMYRRYTLPSIVEVQRVLNDTAVECIDLLDPERGVFVVFDRNTAGRAYRYTRLLVWITHYPHFGRFAGTGLELPENFTDQLLKKIRRNSGTLFRKASCADQKRFLAENFAKICGWILEEREKISERMIASIDMDRCRSYYRIKCGKSEIRDILESRPDFEKDSDGHSEEDIPKNAETYLWLRRGEAKAIERDTPGLLRHGDDDHGVGILGTVFVTDDELIVQTFGRKKFDFARHLIEKYLGNRIRHKRDKYMTAEEMLSEGQPDAHITEEMEEKDSSPIPPEVEKQIMTDFYRNHYKNFLDERVPMIGNMTPREAAKKPSMRPKLIELMKLHIHNTDRMCSEKGVDIDFDWVLDELGLDELKSV